MKTFLVVILSLIANVSYGQGMPDRFRPFEETYYLTTHSENFEWTCTGVSEQGLSLKYWIDEDFKDGNKTTFRLSQAYPRPIEISGQRVVGAELLVTSVSKGRCGSICWNINSADFKANGKKQKDNLRFEVRSTPKPGQLSFAVIMLPNEDVTEETPLVRGACEANEVY